MNRMCGVDWSVVSSLDDDRLINEGALAEQLVGQHLAYAGGPRQSPELHYWQREGRRNNAEVDYVIAVGPWVVPVEVKAGKTGTLKSLHQFVAAKSPPVASRFDMRCPSLTEVTNRVHTAASTTEVRFRLLSVPLYMVTELPRLLTELRQRDA
jgi:hypothetical protein